MPVDLVLVWHRGELVGVYHGLLHLQACKQAQFEMVMAGGWARLDLFRASDLTLLGVRNDVHYQEIGANNGQS